MHSLAGTAQADEADAYHIDRPTSKHPPGMAYRYLVIFLVLCLFPLAGFTQSNSYNLNVYPDIWYNDVDGVRIGGFVLGEMEGEFQSGPHRLDAGVWLGTNLPDLPVSYYLSFTEPILNKDDRLNEGNVRLISSVRTGFSFHELSVNKRWQIGFDEYTFRELNLSFTRQKMFDGAYRPYPQLWSDNWKSLAEIDFKIGRNFEVGRFLFESGVTQKFGTNSFTKIDLEINQQFKLPKGFEIKLRGFSGYISDRAAPEFYYGKSYRPAVEWLQKGISRAEGTIPQNLLDEGLIHLTGGANMRGYAIQELKELNSNPNPLNYQFVGVVNTEVEFPNPVNLLYRESIVGDFIRFRSYLFADAGIFYRDNYQGTPDIILDEVNQSAEAGLGFQFSVNIPDYLGKDRGFALRYEIPFWLSDPAPGDEKFKFRNLIGIGAVISL
ncbi:hypothetical protein [Gracilimonas sp.]|uniref:hypothetical protein n=1 Tax=Gracilimonas sp. TaxID=1974203 RepID=UPI002870BDE5|nr:hypothetical protein [Gracilimonas sp.]